MLRKYFIGSLFIILLLMGCAQSTAAYPNPETETPTSTSLPILSGDWKIKMTHSGGIMGLLRSVEVSADGKYTVTQPLNTSPPAGPKEWSAPIALYMTWKYREAIQL